MTIFRLDGKRALVTGALGRIGAAVAEGLVDAGADTIGLDIAEAPGARAFSVETADLSDPEAATQLVRGLDERFGGFDIWINCAYPRTDDWGAGPPRESPASWTANVTMQMTASCVAADAAAQAMARRGRGGAILNVASIYGLVAPDFDVYDGTTMTTPAAYSAIKGGMINHTRYLAARYGETGVRVNAIAPGGVAAGQPDSFVAAYNRRTALKRMAEAHDLVGPSVFLVSDAAAYVTGVVLPVDGGWTAL
ncbi:MAG: SDR family oxidoreductase [Marivibrio sp.]|uniref:SDR family oxidoreductase n=1 Tax=Marivibrio sp. TaxID=2039719 RepID=UPI0032EC7D5C